VDVHSSMHHPVRYVSCPNPDHALDCALAGGERGSHTHTHTHTHTPRVALTHAVPHSSSGQSRSHTCTHTQFTVSLSRGGGPAAAFRVREAEVCCCCDSLAFVRLMRQAPTDLAVADSRKCGDSLANRCPQSNASAPRCRVVLPLSAACPFSSCASRVKQLWSGHPAHHDPTGT
jgi:hypothetical protein